MQRGRDLMAAGGGDAAHRALVLFDRAIAIRRGFPLDDSRNRYDLAGAWLNRAEALLAIDDAVSVETALRAFDVAVPLLEGLPFDQDSRYLRRLAVALQNRAIGRRRSGREAWKAVPDLFLALGALDTPAGRTLEDARTLQATIWVNLADAQLAERDWVAWHRAIQSTECALALLRSTEKEDTNAAGIGVRARRTCCQAAARCLARVDMPKRDEVVHAATDAVDDALALIAHWEQRGVSSFRSVAADLLEFGRQAYGTYQPQFARQFDQDYPTLRRLLAANLHAPDFTFEEFTVSCHER